MKNLVYSAFAILALVPGLAADGAAVTPARISSGPCIVAPPSDIAERPARWLGDCVAGRGSGLGVLRLGGHEPYAFFVGKAIAGKPSSGLVMDTSGLYTVAMGFDGRNRAIVADGNHIREQDQAWNLAARAARHVADGFAAAGNRSSAAYYQRLSEKIAHGRPE